MAVKLKTVKERILLSIVYKSQYNNTYVQWSEPVSSRKQWDKLNINYQNYNIILLVPKYEYLCFRSVCS